jgi:hypothetical protein
VIAVPRSRVEGLVGGLRCDIREEGGRLAFPDHFRDPLNGHVANHGGSVVRHRELKIALLLRQRVMVPNRKVETIPGQTALTSDEVSR